MNSSMLNVGRVFYFYFLSRIIDGEKEYSAKSSELRDRVLCVYGRLRSKMFYLQT